MMPTIVAILEIQDEGFEVIEEEFTDKKDVKHKIFQKDIDDKNLYEITQLLKE